jgi:hypothetical protein
MEKTPENETETKPQNGFKFKRTREIDSLDEKIIAYSQTHVIPQHRGLYMRVLTGVAPPIKSDKSKVSKLCWLRRYQRASWQLCVNKMPASSIQTISVEE